MEQKALGHIPGIIGRLVRKGGGRERREREKKKETQSYSWHKTSQCVCVERRMIQIWTNISPLHV